MCSCNCGEHGTSPQSTAVNYAKYYHKWCQSVQVDHVGKSNDFTKAPIAREAPSVLRTSPILRLAASSVRSLRVIMPTTVGFGGVTYRSRSPMVLRMRYAWLRGASAGSVHGCSCINARRSNTLLTSCAERLAIMSGSSLRRTLMGRCCKRLWSLYLTF